MADTVNTKTISRLTKLTDSLLNNDLFWISHPSGGSGYNSYSTELSTIIYTAENKISSDIKTAFGLNGMNVSTIKTRVDNLYSGNVTIDGAKTFKVIPKLSSTQENEQIVGLADNAFVTKKHVEKLIDNGGSFIGSDSEINADPQNSTPNTNEDDRLLKWIIPDGKNDSTDFVNEYGEKNLNGVECNATGQLVVYGWLADDGSVLPQESWVAIYGKIENADNQAAQWTILQLQPWHVSDRSKIIQYVGFNIPVKEGLQLKIKTGFRVNSSATATNSGNSLVFPNVQHNVFVGYIVTA